MPATMSSCLNSWGLCGSAYQLPGLQPRGHEEVARALGGRPGQRRGLDLDEPAVEQDVARRAVDLAAQPDGLAGAGAAQVEVAVAQARLLADLDVLVDLERQGRRLAEHLEPGGDDLDVAGGQVGVLVAGGTYATPRR